MTRMSDLEELILKKGLEAAITERDRRRAAVAELADDLRRRLGEAEEGLRSMDQEWVAAYRRASERAGVPLDPGALGACVPSSGDMPNHKWVEEYVRRVGGEARSPDLYRAWEQGQRGDRPRRATIYTVDSNLIRDGVLAKDPLDGESGSMLTLREPRG